MQALGRHFLSDVSAERAVDRLVRLRGILEANGNCCASATGTTVPMMPPINVKNWISPEISIFSASGSPPGSLLFSA
jgi:hypothetical protein